VHVERDGRVLARHAVGSIRPDDVAPMHEGVRFRIASLTKPVVSLAALMLVDEGRLALDAPVGQYLPVLADLRLRGGEKPRAAPTVRDLMRHTSGLAYPFEIAEAALRERWLQAGWSPAMAGTDSAGFLARLAGLPLVAEPGTRFRYGYSTDVLGCIVEQLDGLPLGQALRRRLFDPLGMRHTGFELAPGEPDLAVAHAEDSGWHSAIPAIGRRQPGQPWMDSGGGGLISTLDDYAAFARLLAGGGLLGDRRLLSQACFDAFARNQLPDGVDGPAAYCGPGFGFGLGLAVRHDWGPAAMPCSAGEMVWSGISGTALFVQPRERWFALLFSANMATRMMSRMSFRHAIGRR
jgi:CubicO group peptidase (beta-lactamase class C family)